MHKVCAHTHGCGADASAYYRVSLPYSTTTSINHSSLSARLFAHPLSLAIMAPVTRTASSQDNLAKLAKVPVGISHLVISSSSSSSALTSSLPVPSAPASASASASSATPSFYTAHVSETAATVASVLKPTPIATHAADPPPLPSAIPAWQSALQTITHNIPFFLRTPAEAILGQVRCLSNNAFDISVGPEVLTTKPLFCQECYGTLIYDADLTSSYCFRLAISKGLGLGIVIFGSILKIPQIFKIINGRSARGISLSMYVLEVLAYTISLAYAVRKQIPFSTYGENASLTVQSTFYPLPPSTPFSFVFHHQTNIYFLSTDMIITLLIIAYSPISTGSSAQARRTRVVVAGALMVALSTFLFSPPLCPSGLLSFLQALTIPISLISKVPQMVELHTRKAPGQLSAIVVVAQLAGTMARVFTTLTETNDSLLFWGFALATIFNAVIFVQLILYWNGNDRTMVIGLDGKPQKLD